MAQHLLSLRSRSQKAVQRRSRIARLLSVKVLIAVGLLVSIVGTSTTAGADTSIPVFQSPTQLLSIDGATYTNPNDMSCASLNNCVIVGQFQDGSGIHGFIMSESAGTWGTPNIVDVGPSGTPVNLTNVSCPSVGNCTAVGTFQDLAYNSYPIALSEQDGNWGPAVQLASGDSGNPTGLSCWAPGNCTLTGEDTTQGSIPVVMNEANYQWDNLPTALQFPTTPSGYYLQSISCPSAGNCTAIGTNSDDSSFAVEELNGGWLEATNLLNPSGYPTVLLTSVSCSTPTNCTAVGHASVVTPPGAPLLGSPPLVSQGIGITESNGQWGSYSVFTNPANVTSATLSSVSCTGAGNCTAVGFSGSPQYTSPTVADPQEGCMQFASCSFLGNGVSITESSGVWGGFATQQTSNLSPETVVCVTSALCTYFGSMGISSVWAAISVPQLTLSTNSPANPDLGQAYSAQFLASGGVAPYVFSLTQGSLPLGLSIDPTTGVVSGVPTTAGTYSFTVTVTDASDPAQSVSALVTLVVGAKLAATGANLRSLALEGLGLLGLGMGLVEITRRRFLRTP